MNESDKRLWWQAYCAVVASIHSDPEPTFKAADEAARKAAELAVESYHEACGPADPDPPAGPYEGWAHLEVMGHRSHYGLVREVRAFGTRLVEIRELNGDGDLVDAVIQYGGAAIFANTQIEEEVARHMARGEHRCQCRHIDAGIQCARELWSKEHWRAYCDGHKAAHADEFEEMAGLEEAF